MEIGNYLGGPSQTADLKETRSDIENARVASALAQTASPKKARPALDVANYLRKPSQIAAPK